MKIERWDDGLAIRLPASVIEALGLKEGDEVEIHIAGDKTLSVARKPGREVLLRRLRAFRGRLPVDFNSTGTRRIPVSCLNPA